MVYSVALKFDNHYYIIVKQNVPKAFLQVLTFWFHQNVSLTFCFTKCTTFCFTKSFAFDILLYVPKILSWHFIICENGLISWKRISDWAVHFTTSNVTIYFELCGRFWQSQNVKSPFCQKQNFILSKFLLCKNFNFIKSTKSIFALANNLLTFYFTQIKAEWNEMLKT